MCPYSSVTQTGTPVCVCGSCRTCLQAGLLVYRYKFGPPTQQPKGPDRQRLMQQVGQEARNPSIPIAWPAVPQPLGFRLAFSSHTLFSSSAAFLLPPSFCGPAEE